MNPIDELRAARPAHLGDRPVDERTRAAELSQAMSRPRAARRRRAIVRRPVWGLGLAGAGAAATAVLVLASGNGPAPTPRAPDQAQAVTTATVRLPARDVLLAAAENAGRQTETTGDYWHTVLVNRTLFTASEGGYAVVERTREESWTPSATGGEQWSRTRSLGARPATAEDRRAWERAGSPAEIEVGVPVPKAGDKGAVKSFTVSTSPGREETGRSPLVDGDKVFWLGRNVTMKDLRGLPDEPGELKRWLLDAYEGHGTESSSEEMSADVWLFKVSAGLITAMPVTPQVRGAAFRMLAELDTVKVTADVADAEGRRGAAVSIEEDVPGRGILEERLIFDEATGRALANESVVVAPAGAQAGFAPGTVSHSAAVIEASWTDTRP